MMFTSSTKAAFDSARALACDTEERVAALEAAAHTFVQEWKSVTSALGFSEEVASLSALAAQALHEVSKSSTSTEHREATLKDITGLAERVWSMRTLDNSPSVRRSMGEVACYTSLVEVDSWPPDVWFAADRYEEYTQFCVRVLRWVDRAWSGDAVADQTLKREVASRAAAVLSNFGLIATTADTYFETRRRVYYWAERALNSDIPLESRDAARAAAAIVNIESRSIHHVSLRPDHIRLRTHLTAGVDWGCRAYKWSMADDRLERSRIASNIARCEFFLAHTFDNFTQDLANHLQEALRWSVVSYELNPTTPSAANATTIAAYASLGLAVCFHRGVGSSAQKQFDHALYWIDRGWKIIDCSDESRAVLAGVAIQTYFHLAMLSQDQSQRELSWAAGVHWAHKTRESEREGLHAWMWVSPNPLFASHLLGEWGHDLLISGRSDDALEKWDLASNWIHELRQALEKGYGFQSESLTFDTELAPSSFAVHYLLLGYWEKFEHVLDDLLAISTAAKEQSHAIAGIASQVASRSRRHPEVLRTHWEYIKGAIVLSSTDQPMPFPRTSLLVALAVGNILIYYSNDPLERSQYNPRVVLGDLDAVIDVAAACFRLIPPSDFRLYCSDTINEVCATAIDLAWSLPDFADERSVAARVLRAQSLNDLFLLIAGHSQSPDLPFPGQRFPSGEDLLQDTIAIARTEDRTFVSLFDTGLRILRIIIDSDDVPWVAEVHVAGSVDGDVDAGEQGRLAARQKYGEYRRCLRSRESDGDSKPIFLDEIHLTAMADRLLDGVDSSRITLLPHGFTHDALCASAWSWAERHSQVVEQVTSIGTYLALRAGSKRHGGPSGRPVVAILLAEDIVGYVETILPILVARIAPVATLICYSIERLVAHDGTRYNQTLREWHSQGWKRSSVIEIDVDFCIVLTHGEFCDNSRSAFRDSHLSFALGAEEPWLHIGPHSIDTDGNLYLPTVTCHEDIHNPIIHPHGFRLGLARCSIVVSGACAGGRISEELGEDGAGLVRMFFVAGVSAVVAAAWPVLVPSDDSPERDLMATLWDSLIANLVTGSTVIEAVRIARRRARAMAAGVSGRNGSPNSYENWGYFMLHGFGSTASPWPQHPR
jgi:hypothetical protein